MKYLQNAIEFLIKHWILAVPLFILTALGAIIAGSSTNAVANLGKLWTLYSSMGQLAGPGGVFSSVPAILPAVAAGSGIWVLLFNFIAIPATYGLVNKSLDTGNASLSDIGAAISRNFAKYVMYFAGMLLLFIIIGVACILILLVFTLLSLLIRPLAVLTILAAIALALAIIILMVLLSMWLSAMVVDDLNVTAAVRRSIEIVRACFWTVLGITILVAVACGIAGWLLGWFHAIPLLGPVIASIVPTAQTFLMLIFLLILYREQTGKSNLI